MIGLDTLLLAVVGAWIVGLYFGWYLGSDVP